MMRNKLFGIPIGLARESVALLGLLLVLPCLALATPGWLGVGMADVTQDKLGSLKLKEERGIEIVTVVPDSPAAKAGLKEHDVVLEFSGTRVDSVEQFQRLVRETPSGRNVSLLISRDGNQQTINVKLGESRQQPSYRVYMPDFKMPGMPPMPPMPRMPNIPMPDIQIYGLANTTRIGVDVEPLSKQLGQFFGVPEGEGVLVRSVDPGSPAEKAGIKAGDVIIKVAGEKVSDARDIRMLMRENAEKKGFPVVLVRNKKETTVTVNIEPRERTRPRPPTRGERLE